MKPAKYDDTPYAKWMETKSTIYFPLNYVLWELKWQFKDYSKFQAPFANGLYYKIMINENNETKCLEIDFNNY